MQKEIFYGNDGLYKWNDCNASGEFTTSAVSSKENDKVDGENTGHFSDFNNSNPRLDKYFLYFSSKL